MHGTLAQRHCRPHAEDVSFAPRPYWGWSHGNQRMEFMDLLTYMESFRRGYDAAFGDLLTRVQQLGWPTGAVPGPLGWPTGAAPGSVSAPQSPTAWGSGSSPGWHGHHHHRHHQHEARCGEHHGCGCEHAHDRDGGCRHDRECHDCEHDRWAGHDRCGEHRGRCDCCVVDADIIIYGHCGEIRVVPIEIDNDSRKVRENVDVQVSDVRSGSRKVLAWPTLIQPQGPLTLEPCRTTRLELLVQIACGGESGEASQDAPANQDAPVGALATLAAQRDLGNDVDRCEVGYATVRLEGCLVRPIVVAIAALPRGCESYRVGCSCSCCC